LDKAKSKKNIKDLQQDLADGVLLSDLVETICELIEKLNIKLNTSFIIIIKSNASNLSPY